MSHADHGYISAVVNLTLVDLPGLTKVAVGNFNSIIMFFSYFASSILVTVDYWLMMSSAEGQPESIVEDIENMVRSYVAKVCPSLI